MPNLLANLILDRCPHCSIADPNLDQRATFETVDHAGHGKRWWAVYACKRCGGLVTAMSIDRHDGPVREYYPLQKTVKDDIPERPRAFLQQALDSLHAPAGAVMLAASAIDAMLKVKSYTEGSLYARIEKAAADHVITSDMAKWAHDVRLDANDQRHADEAAGLPSPADAERVVEFASALGEILFVLPARVKQGLKASGNQS